MVGEAIRLHRGYRVGLRVAALVLLMGLCAASASAQLFRIQAVDTPRTVQDVLAVQAEVVSPRPIATATAEVVGRPPIGLTFDAATDRWKGDLSFVGLTQNQTYGVALRATDIDGNVAQPFIFNVRQDPQPPVVTITSPAPDALGTPDLRLKASCTDGGVPCRLEVTAKIPGAPMPGFRWLASGMGEIDTIVSLPVGRHDLEFTGTDAAGATAVDVIRRVYADTSPVLKPFATFPGQIYDLSATHALVLDDVSLPQRLLLVDRASSAITVLWTLHLERVEYARLVSDAVVFSVHAISENVRRLYEWRGGTTMNLGVMEFGFGVRFAAPYIVWISTTGPSLMRRNVLTGTNATIAPSPTTVQSLLQFDVGSNGDVVWNADVGGHLQVFRARGEVPATTQLTTDATSKFGVLTDGTNVIFRREPTNPPQNSNPDVDVVLITPSNEQSVAQFPLSFAPSSTFAVENGWVAFTRVNPTTFLRETWRRAPDGTTTLIDTGFGLLSTLQANGDLLLSITNMPRVLVRANGTRRELHENAGTTSFVDSEEFSSTGRFFFLDGEWHLANGPHLLRFSPAAQSILAEGSTGSFFDTDIAIFNPSATETVEAHVRYLREDGNTIDDVRQLAPRSHTLIRADTISGVEGTPFSTVVDVADGAPLVVERLMTWDADGYGGHASNATDRPRLRWMFAEGAQGTFDTFFLLVNDNNADAEVRMTFLREGLAPLLHSLTIGPRARRTFSARELPGLIDTAFSTIVDASVPILAERAMYFGGPPFWSGGHDAVGAPELSHRWFFAEGATGPLFDTFILIGNPHAQPVFAQLIFHTEDGRRVAKQVTLPPLSRTTINIENLDPQIASVGVATVVVTPFETPVIAERALYWAIDGSGVWTDGHASFGATTDAARWGLADGRVGGPRQYQTFVLVNNAFGTLTAHVTVTFVRDDGQEFVRNFTCASGQRLTILAHDIPELADSTFSVIVETPVSEPISVERATYWNVDGVVWAAGANVQGTRLP